MIPVRQTIFGVDLENRVFGNCHQACVASLLELPLDEVPHFYYDNDGIAGERRVAEFLDGLGLAQASIPFHTDDLNALLVQMETWAPGIEYILGGMSPRGHNHSVVCCGERLIHDPHPSDDFVNGPMKPDGFFWVTYILPRSPARARAAYSATAPDATV